MRRLIVDGYNVIGRVDGYSRLAEVDMDAARAALVSDVAAFSHDEYDTLVVFDGAGNPNSTGDPHVVAGVTVVFSPTGVSADSVIERAAREAREAGSELVVVTSDAQLQWAVMGGPVVRMSSGEFARSLGEGSTEWRAHSPSGSTRGRLEDLVDPAVRDVLWRWARGG